MKIKRTAADAIAAVRSRSRLTVLSPEALKELREMLKHNDKEIDRTKRVSAKVAIEILQGCGWNGCSPAALDKACRSIGRQSWSRP